MNSLKITLQISLAPTDLPHAKHILPHQLRQWAGQVDEVLLVIDLHRSRGRFAEGWEERLPGLRQLVDEYSLKYPNIVIQEVDYSEVVAKAISKTFFGGQPVPAKDWNGGPFYSYFFGLMTAKYNYVFHMDSDMLYGGGSSTWIAEAIHLLSEREDVLVCSPLPGPPTSNGQLRSQVLEKELYDSLAFRSATLSTRHFLLDKNRLATRIQQLSLTQPSRWRILEAVLEGNPPYDLPEHILSKAMQKQKLIRIEFLGSEPGMWSIHPPYRSEIFYSSLPDIIQLVEAGNIPEAQRGCHDINNSLVDWTSCKSSSGKRALKHIKTVADRFLPFQTFKKRSQLIHL